MACTRARSTPPAWREPEVRERDPPLEGLVIPPDVERKRALRCLHGIRDDSRPLPSTLFIEARGSFVANRAAEPGSVDAPRGQSTFGVVSQRDRGAGSASQGRHPQLVELVALDPAEAKRSAGRTDDTNRGEAGAEPVSEILECAQSGELGRNEWRVRLVPDLVPEVSERIDVCVFGGSYIHSSITEPGTRTGC